MIVVLIGCQLPSSDTSSSFKQIQLDDNKVAFKKHVLPKYFVGFVTLFAYITKLQHILYSRLIMHSCSEDSRK